MSAQFKFCRLRLLSCFAFMAFSLMAQIPQEDSRNVNVPNTDTHFEMRKYRTLAEWAAHKQKLRAQILSRRG